MFVYTASDVVGAALVILLIVSLIYVFIRRWYYINIKWKKCPKCGGDVYHSTEIHYMFGDQNTYEVFGCKKCDWKDSVKR